MVELTYSIEHRVLFVTLYESDGSRTEIVGHSADIIPVVLGDSDWQLGRDENELTSWRLYCKAFLWMMVQEQEQLGIEVEANLLGEDLFAVLSAQGETYSFQIGRASLAQGLQVISGLSLALACIEMGGPRVCRALMSQQWQPEISLH